MRPLLFRWRAFTVWSYPALLYVGCTLGVLYGHAVARARGLPAFRVWAATLLLLFIAILGARLLYVATHWSHYRHQWHRIITRTEGGAAQYGGLLLAVPLSWPLLAEMGVPFGAFWDIGIQVILVGMVFTRVGCLLNGCCAGRATSIFGVNLPNRRGVWTRRVPTQILESVFGATLLVAGTWIWPWLPFDGALFLVIVAAYGTGRLVLESLREHEPGTRAFSVQHAISLGLVAAAVGSLSILWPR